MTQDVLDKGRELATNIAITKQKIKDVDMWISGVERSVWYGIRIADAHTTLKDLTIMPNKDEMLTLLTSMRKRYTEQLVTIEKEFEEL